jgi:hypothetical protein
MLCDSTVEVTLENPRVMKLTDNNYTGIVFGAVLLIFGIFFLTSWDSGMVIVALGLLFSLVGIAYIVSARMITITVDKDAGRLKTSVRAMAGRNERESELSMVKGITLVKKSTARLKGRVHYVYLLKFKLDAGTELQVELGTGTSGLEDIAMYDAVKKVADFIGMPLSVSGPLVRA